MIIRRGQVSAKQRRFLRRWESKRYRAKVCERIFDQLVKLDESYVDFVLTGTARLPRLD